MQRVYLDHNATTPVAPAVREAMRPFLEEKFGNPSSSHALGREAALALDDARLSVAAMLGASPREIVFTASGTEAANLALFGMLHGSTPKRRHIVSTSVEHPCVAQTCRTLGLRGDATVTFVEVDERGRVSADKVLAAVRPETALVSVMLAQNETGTIHPVAEIVAKLKSASVLFHTDATQAIGKIPVDVEKLGVDLLSLSAHKFYGPKGAGALYVRGGTHLHPILHGGGQEHGLRAGTEAVPALVGLGAAAQLVRERLADDATQMARLREQFEKKLLGQIGDLAIHGDLGARLPNTTSVGFRGIDGPALAVLCDEQGLFISAGSACHAGVTEPSATLQAMGVGVELSRGTVRVSLGRDTTEADVDYAVGVLAEAVRRLRDQSGRRSEPSPVRPASPTR